MVGKLAVIAALALVPALAVAQNQDTTHRDTTVQGQAGGAIAPTAGHGLTSLQVRQLQEALNKAGCTAGSANGTWSSSTEQAVQCVRDKKHIQTQNFNDVLRALNLSFTAPDSVATSTSTTQTYPTPPRSDTLRRDTAARHDTASHQPPR